MVRKDAGLSLTPEEIAEAFDDPQWSSRFPPVLTPEQAAELLQMSMGTFYAWSSQGRLKSCCRKNGKHLRVFRNRLIQVYFNEGWNSHEK